LPELEDVLARACEARGTRCALTGFSAAARLAPMVRDNRLWAIVEDAPDVAAQLGLKPVPSGANAILMEPYDAGVFYGVQATEGVCVASPIQVYLDLSRMRARGEEAAQALLAQVIEPSW
jgi:hypothetical protein